MPGALLSCSPTAKRGDSEERNKAKHFLETTAQMCSMKKVNFTYTSENPNLTYAQVDRWSLYRNEMINQGGKPKW